MKKLSKKQARNLLTTYHLGPSSLSSPRSSREEGLALRRLRKWMEKRSH
jgi:hypothetical protein